MHLLNTLPQRLDPGATPTFAGLISATLTSPAATNLTLGTGSFGTALTVASATGAATFAGTVTVSGTQTNLGGAVFTTTNNVNIRGTNAGIAIYNSVAGSSNNWSTIRNTATGSDSNLIFSTNTVPALTLDGSANATFAGAVTVSSTTAGSSGAGALVVTGGLATGAASYFGGLIKVVATGQNPIGPAFTPLAWGTSSIDVNGFIGLYDSGSVKGYLAAQAAGGLGYNTQGAGTHDFFVVGTNRATISSTGLSVNGAATFAGTVSPQQATTAAAPSYVKGAIYFDTTLNKLRVGGATAWETITSV